MAPSTFPPHPEFYASILHISQETARLSVPVCSKGAGFNPPEFWSSCDLPVSCCLATSVVLAVAFDWLPLRGGASAGPAWSSLAQDLHGSGRNESGIRTVLLPGPCLAQRLDSADVDSRVWLASTWTYITFAVPYRYILGSGVELNE